MNSQSSWICREIGRNESSAKDQIASEIEKQSQIQRLDAVERVLAGLCMSSELIAATFRRLETARRFLRSDELGGCNYELCVLEKLISQLNDQAEG